MDRFSVMNESTDYRTALKKLTVDRPIAYHRIYGQIAGSTTAGIMLSQLLYWWDKKYEEYVWKTIEEFEQETGLSRWEQATAIKKLVSRGYLRVEVKGLPAKRRFYLNEEAIFAALAGKPQPELKEIPKNEPQRPTGNDTMHRSSITDSVTAITSNGNKKRKQTPNQKEFVRLSTNPDIKEVRQYFLLRTKLPKEDGYNELTVMQHWEKLLIENDNKVSEVKKLIDVLVYPKNFWNGKITNGQKLWAHQTAIIANLRDSSNRVAVMK